MHQTKCYDFDWIYDLYHPLKWHIKIFINHFIENFLFVSIESQIDRKKMAVGGNREQSNHNLK